MMDSKSNVQEVTHLPTIHELRVRGETPLVLLSAWERIPGEMHSRTYIVNSPFLPEMYKKEILKRMFLELFAKFLDFLL